MNMFKKVGVSLLTSFDSPGMSVLYFFIIFHNIVNVKSL